jgi:hypothetical protein
MTRLVLGGVAATILLLIPGTAQGDSAARVRGTVAFKDSPNHVVTVRSARNAVGLSVPGSLALIRVGQRVELRGSTLRQKGNGSRILARHVTIASSRPLATPPPRQDDDEIEIKGTLTSLSPLTVHGATRTVSCVVPTGMGVGGFAIGDFVEITCDLKGGVFVLRKLEHEDDEEEVDDDRGDNSGPGNVDEDDHESHDHSGPGGGDDDDEHGGNSGPGGGGDDD